MRATILDAVVQVLPEAGEGLSAKEIYNAVISRGLFDFKAADPPAIVRSAIRKHLRSHGGATQRPARVRAVGTDRFLRA